MTTVLSVTSDICVWQARTALPLRWTVQAPHSPAPQPYFVPVSPTWSRMTHSSGVRRLGIDRDPLVVQGEGNHMTSLGLRFGAIAGRTRLPTPPMQAIETRLLTCLAV